MLQPNNDLLFLYIGPTQAKSSAATISWENPKIVVPSNNGGGNNGGGDNNNNNNNAAAFMKSAQCLILVCLAYFML